MDQYLYIPFLGGWTSIYQLFWGSLGTRVLTHCHMFNVGPKMLKTLLQDVDRVVGSTSLKSLCPGLFSWISVVNDVLLWEINTWAGIIFLPNKLRMETHQFVNQRTRKGQLWCMLSIWFNHNHPRLEVCGCFTKTGYNDYDHYTWLGIHHSMEVKLYPFPH